MEVDEVLAAIKEEGCEYVDLRFTDPRGKLQHVTLIIDAFDEDMLEEGMMFDGSSIAGWKSIEASDMKLMPDHKSLYFDPFYSERRLACTAPSSSLTRGKHTSAIRAGRQKRRKPI